MGFQLNTSVLNQKGSPAIYTDTFANRPPFGYAGRLFISNDTAAIYEDTGTAWVLIANVSSGAGTLQQVTTNGNTSNVGISVTAGGVSTNSATITSLTQGSVPFVGAAGLITQDNANLFFDDTNNRLGINTNTPGNTLDVHTAGTNPILALNNTAGNQSAISFLNTNVSQWRIGNKATTNTLDIFNFILNNHALRINIGDNSIEITNNINVQSNGSILGSNANGSDPVRIQANNVQKVIRFLNPSAGTADLYVAGTSTSSAFYFSTFSTANALRIENSGNVLITTPSDDGVNKLQVTGSGKITTNLNIGTRSTGSIRNLNVYGDTNNNAIIKIDGADGNGYGAQIDFISKTGAGVSNTWTIGTGLNFGFNAWEIYNGTNTVLSAHLTGNVSIGSFTDDTVNKLQVTGSAKITSLLTMSRPSSGSTNISMEGSSAFGDNSNLNFCSFRSIIKSTILVSAGGDTDLSFSTQIGGVVAERFYVDGIGQFKINNLAGTGSRAVLADATGILSAPVSDQSVKENIEPLKYGLETIMKLNAVQFKFIEGYKNFGEGLQLGAIAQEVEQIIPEAVFKTPSTGLKGIDYNQFNAIYIKAIQDQQKIIESLIQRIELLENK
jgi:hypothetical protein